jgi:hypothetical protein
LQTDTSDGAPKTKGNGAAAVKPTEIAVEQLGGKKKSKFWFYAVEPAPTPSGVSSPGGTASTSMNGHQNNGDTSLHGISSNALHPTHDNGDVMDIDSRKEGTSLSPVPLEGLRSV